MNNKPEPATASETGMTRNTRKEVLYVYGFELFLLLMPALLPASIIAAIIYADKRGWRLTETLRELEFF